MKREVDPQKLREKDIRLRDDGRIERVMYLGSLSLTESRQKTSGGLTRDRSKGGRGQARQDAQSTRGEMGEGFRRTITPGCFDVASKDHHRFAAQKEDSFEGGGGRSPITMATIALELDMKRKTMCSSPL